FFLGRWTFLIARYGIPPDHTQRIEATECIDHLVSYALGEVVLAFVAGLVGEGQHRDDGDRAGRGRLRWLGESRNSGWLAQQGEPCTRREKNGDGCRPSHQRAPRPSPSGWKRRRNIGRGKHRRVDAIYSYRVRNVLELLLAHVGNRNFDLAANLPVGIFREADPARGRNLLEPRGNVDAIAEHIALFDDDVAYLAAAPDLHAPP